MLCTAAFAEGGLSTPTDLCTHEWDASTGKCNTCQMVCAHAQYEKKTFSENHWECTVPQTEDKEKKSPAKNVTLIVYESAPGVTIQLDTGANLLVKKALTIFLLENNAPMTLKSAVKLSIPMAEDANGLKLPVMNENGELVEIEYEIIDGAMVFETEILGIFPSG